jgi:hypothetical protein
VETGLEKVAIFAKGETALHVARQLPSGKWTSKIGRWEDIEHDLLALEGERYGEVAQIMQRGVPSPGTPKIPHPSGASVDPVEHYFHELRDIHASGAVPETSYYGPLATLLNSGGARLRPPVRCIIHPRNRGAGIPDGALFTADQLPRDGEAPPG